MRTVTGGVIIGGEGGQQIAGLSNIAVRNFSQRDHFGFWGGTAQVSLDHCAGIPGPQGGGRIYSAHAPHAVRGRRQ